MIACLSRGNLKDNLRGTERINTKKGWRGYLLLASSSSQKPVLSRLSPNRGLGFRV